MQKRGDILILALIFCSLLAGCSGCEGEKTSTQIDPSYEPEKTQVDENLKAMEKNIEETIDAYMAALDEARFDEFVNFVHPALFNSEEEKTQQIESLKDIYDRGWHNEVNNVEVFYISPLVDLDSAWVAVVKFNVDMAVNFTEDFVGKPKVWENQIKDAFSYATVTYDSVGTKYDITGPNLAYAFSDKDSIDFKFVTDRFIRNPRMNRIIDADKLLILKGYE